METRHPNDRAKPERRVESAANPLSSGDLVSTLGRIRKINDMLRGGKRMVVRKPSLSEIDGEDRYLDLHKPKD